MKKIKQLPLHKRIKHFTVALGARELTDRKLTPQHKLTGKTFNIPGIDGSAVVSQTRKIQHYGILGGEQYQIMIERLSCTFSGKKATFLKITLLTKNETSLVNVVDINYLITRNRKLKSINIGGEVQLSFSSTNEVLSLTKKIELALKTIEQAIEH